MGAVDWGISTGDIDNFDREKQFAPYRGQTPPNAVYRWRITQLKFSPGTDGKYPQLRIGVELIPRNKQEQKYKGFRLISFRVVAPQTAFNYVPLLDALGVSSSDFKNRTIADGEGNISRIGKWRNDGKQEIDALLKDDEDGKGNARKDIGWIGAVVDDEPDDSDDDDYLDDSEEEYADDVDDSDEYDEDDDVDSDEVEDYYDYEDE
jgi:hypothetical protein